MPELQRVQKPLVVTLAPLCSAPAGRVGRRQRQITSKSKRRRELDCRGVTAANPVLGERASSL